MHATLKIGYLFCIGFVLLLLFFYDMQGWTMVFKFVGGNIPSPTAYQLWTSSKTISEHVISALDTTSAHRGHYKNRIVQNWQTFNPLEVSRCEF